MGISFFEAIAIAEAEQEQLKDPVDKPIEAVDQNDPAYWAYDPARLAAAWEQVGVKVDPWRVAEHWQDISEWLNRKPKTVRYMTPEERTALDKDTARSVSTMRLELQRLRQSETPEQQQAR